MGGSVASVLVTTEGDGTKTAQGGAVAPVLVTTSGDGTKMAQGGAVVNVLVTTSGGGAKTKTQGGSVSTVLVITLGGGVKATQGGSVAGVTIATTGGGSRHGGSVASVTVTAAGGGSRHGGSVAGVLVTAPSGGIKSTQGGSEADVIFLSSTGGGFKTAIEGSEVSIIVTTQGGGSRSVSYLRLPTWMPDPQSYAIHQERYRHEGALTSFGEYSMYVLLWNSEDFDAGLVNRCPTCFVAYGKIAETYGQSAKEKCPECFGTTFEGGYRAKIVRPSMWDFSEDVEQLRSRGEVTVQKASVQSTHDFRLRSGDFVFRADGTRWRAETVGTNHLRTGFDMPDVGATPVGYNYSEVTREEDTSVAFLVPPEDLTVLDVPMQRYPQDWSAVEEPRNYLTVRP